MAYLVDTNLIIEHAKGISKTIELLRLLKEKDNLFCSVISFTEFRVGLKKNIDFQMRRVKETYFPLEVTSEIAELAGEYLQKYVPRILKFDISDAIIAATAIVNKMTLVTHNIKHFPMSEIKIAEKCRKVV